MCHALVVDFIERNEAKTISRPKRMISKWTSMDELCCHVFNVCLKVRIHSYPKKPIF